MLDPCWIELNWEVKKSTKTWKNATNTDADHSRNIPSDKIKEISVAMVEKTKNLIDNISKEDSRPEIYIITDKIYLLHCWWLVTEPPS